MIKSVYLLQCVMLSPTQNSWNVAYMFCARIGEMKISLFPLKIWFCVDTGTTRLEEKKKRQAQTANMCMYAYTALNIL